MLEYLPQLLSWINAVLGLAGGVFTFSQVRSYGVRRGLIRLVAAIMIYIGLLYLCATFSLIPAQYLSVYFLRSAMTMLLGAVIALLVAERPYGPQ